MHVRNGMALAVVPAATATAVRASRHAGSDAPAKEP